MISDVTSGLAPPLPERWRSNIRVDAFGFRVCEAMSAVRNSGVVDAADCRSWSPCISGKVGAATIHELIEAGHTVTGCDVVAPVYEGGDAGAHYVQADLTDAGDAFAVVRGQDVVIHCAALPEPTRNPPPPCSATTSWRPSTSPRRVCAWAPTGW